MKQTSYQTGKSMIELRKKVRRLKVNEATI